ncbi:lysozyme inhibitor LprI family protein [Rubrivivax albus]|uniref:DUF1311 domain-containing protein n=1 Tax=Rubrivivax albus TaxID=2499835 RepID=A0A437JKM8_9BURK|nr:DUF1311 domain-containing protein [Rubrivivax albus]
MRSPTLYLQALLLASCASAQPGSEEFNQCTGARTQAAWNACESAGFSEAERRLATLYHSYSKRLQGEQRENFERAQAAWVRYRELACSFESSGVAGGSAYPAVFSACMREKTRRRLSELERLASCEEGDLSCPSVATKE